VVEKIRENSWNSCLPFPRQSQSRSEQVRPLEKMRLISRLAKIKNFSYFLPAARRLLMGCHTMQSDGYEPKFLGFALCFWWKYVVTVGFLTVWQVGAKT
jgi:hypothetical protein